ncbi:hypothetical protein [Thalassospira lucentensis]|uniref:hypothetical protein n=1 Tax=Thalassospira lucentensis TaxID=168935 RepID=UPI00399D6F29
MCSLDEVYRKFGEVSEAAQLLETELGTMLMMLECTDAELLQNPDPEKAGRIRDQVNKKTLGRLISKLKDRGEVIEGLEDTLEEALDARNFMNHSFYRYHNFRRNTSAGCQIMFEDLERIHSKILQAYTAVLLLSGVDLDKLVKSDGSFPLPVDRVKL